MERVFFLFLLFLAYSSSRSIPFRSVKSPDEIIHNYEFVNLEISSRSSNRRLEEHPSTLSVSVKQDSIQLFALQLELNKNLIAPHFASVYTNSDGIQVSETHPNCFYHGIVNGHPKLQAVISTCHGLRGWFGDLNNENSLYHLEPLTKDHLRVSPEKDTLANTHVLYKDTENKKKLQNAVCGTPHGNVSADRFKVPSEGGSSLHRMRRQSGGASNIVELLIVNDNNQYIAYGRNISAVVLRAIEIFSHVDMLYQSINVRVVIVYSLTWTARQEITFSSVPNTLLTLFRQYHSGTAAFRSITHDSAQLITGIDLDGNTVGIAFVGTMCNFDSSVGLTQDTRGSVASVATIAAHEMGHTFGMNHDDDSSCNCPDSNSGCIMNAVSRFPPATRWSQCSINELNAGFAGSGNSDLNRCLGNSPTTIVGTARCGNGIREPGETCDCGSLAECNDPCCNATTCKLASTAQCSSGVCCENCRFKSYGTTCRNSSGMCDILEYCTGLNADCPTDVTRQNGVPCDSNNAYCYDGTCGSTRDQCNRYFGSVSVPSNDVCYTQLNTLGVGWGHCGADGTNYIPCTTGNAFCGSLQCNGGSIIFNNVNSRSALTAYTRFASNQECRSVSTPADADEVSPGLVVDGASCGTNRMCVNQRCSLITSLEGVSPCPIGSNGQNCSGNGVCNNLNQCSCNVGYTGSDCSQILGTTPTSDIPTPSSSSSSTANAPSTSTSSNVQSSSTPSPSSVTSDSSSSSKLSSTPTISPTSIPSPSSSSSSPSKSIVINSSQTSSITSSVTSSITSSPSSSITSSSSHVVVNTPSIVLPRPSKTQTSIVHSMTKPTVSQASTVSQFTGPTVTDLDDGGIVGFFAGGHPVRHSSG